MGDVNSTDRIATAIEGLYAAIASYAVPLGAKTASSSAWDNDTAALALPTGTQFIHVYCEGDMWLVATVSANAPGDPCIYPGGVAHVLGTRGMGYLHYKNAEADDTQQIYVTAYRATAS